MPTTESRSPDRLIRAGQAARLLAVGASTIQRWIDAGHIPAHRTLGGHRRIRMADLRAFAAARGLRLPAGEDGGEPPALARGCDVLLVDDEPDFLAMLRVRVCGLRPDLQVQTAASGFSAGYLAAQSRPRLVLLDIRMPGVDGVEVCRMIKAGPHAADTRVVGLTASRAESEIAALLDAGAARVLFKPLDTALLWSELDALEPTRPPR